MSLWLRRLLSRFLLLPVIDGDPDPATDTGATDVPAPGADDTLDDLLDATDVEDIPRGTTGDEPEPEALRSSRQNEERLNRELEAERAARRALESRSSAPATPSRDPAFDAEEARLAEARRSGMSANDIGWLQWQINADRQMRSNKQHADTALSEARDIADRTSFDRLEITKPQVFKRYATRVETEMSKMRAAGQNAPRLAVLQFLIGQDVMNGSVKKKSAPKPATDGQAAGTVDRGRTPGVRTDVRGRAAALTERDKRRARLENQPL